MFELEASPRPAEEWLVSEQTRSRLAALDGALAEAVRNRDPDLEKLSLHLVERPGKRIRPALVFLTAEFGCAEARALRTAAMGVELLHIGSLYHDDLMDAAALRRGSEAPARRWGDARAAMAGTYLLGRAIGLLASLGDPVNEMVSKAALALCTGQLQEAENAYNLELSPKAHLTIIARKTATLFDLPCRVGATISGVPADQFSTLVEFSQHLGVAFQLVDDVLDLKGEVGRMGKYTGTDMREGIYTLAVLLAREADEGVAEALSLRLRRIRVTDADRLAVLELLRECGALAAAMEIAEQHATRARSTLETLPPGPARESLSRLTFHVTKRTG